MRSLDITDRKIEGDQIEVVMVLKMSMQKNDRTVYFVNIKSSKIIRGQHFAALLKDQMWR